MTLGDLQNQFIGKDGESQLATKWEISELEKELPIVKVTLTIVEKILWGEPFVARDCKIF